VGVTRLVGILLRALVANRAALAMENLALRQQLAVLKRSVKRPALRPRDRLFWTWLSRLWNGWRVALLIVKPETVIQWHRQGFRLYWRWKSRGRGAGRPKIKREIRDLIRRLSRENPLWGVPRIQAELRLLGHDVADGSVTKYMVHARKPPSPTWRTFLKNHAHQIAAIDFFAVPTVTFSVLYGFVILWHDRRRVAHFNVTTHPTAEWTARQVIQAFPYEEAPRFLLRDRDGIYGAHFRECLKHLEIEEVKIAPRAPWQNPYVERLIGSIRRECLDHVIVLNEDHLHRILTEYFAYYHHARTHLALGRNAPMPRAVEPPAKGEVVSTPYLGGLHHLYTRAA
jgi:transposase InsO family protein